MQSGKKKACCFFGYRYLYDNDGNLFELLVKEIERLIKFNEFVFDGYGEFDVLSYKAVKKLKEKYPDIETVYIQAYYKHEDERMAFLSKQYNAVVYPAIGDKPKKFAITYRNQAIIDGLDFCVFYVKRNYGGALQATQYAKRKKKASVNLAERIIPIKGI